MPSRPMCLATRVILAGGLALLAGCGGAKKDQFAPPCPTAQIVRDAGDLSRYRDATSAANQDIRGLVATARIVAIPAKCQAGDTPKQLAADVGVMIRVTRGPAMPGRTFDVPFFLAITEGGEIKAKTPFMAHVEFPPNTEETVWTSDLVHMVFPINETKSGAAYTVLAGFQLTPDELAYNRSHPQSGP